MGIMARESANASVDGRPKVRVGGVWVFIIMWAVLGVIFFVGGLIIGGGYLGRSGQVTGDVIAVNSGRPVVQYTVDGTTYQHSTTEHGPWFSVGQQVTLAYDPGNPTHAQTARSRTISVVFLLLGSAFLVILVAHAAWVARRYRRQCAAVQRGRLVEASVTGSRFNEAAHIRSKILWYVSCAWTDPMNARQHTFTSGAVWSSSDPVPLLRAAKITTLPVYIDPLDPDKRFYVDDRPIRDAVAAVATVR